MKPASTRRLFHWPGGIKREPDLHERVYGVGGLMVNLLATRQATAFVLLPK
jgi:hypothetical protein